MNDLRACCLCSQIQGVMENDLLHQLLGGPYRRRIALESDYFALIPSLGPLVPGHSLVCPKEHIKNLASLDKRFTPDYIRFVNLAKARLTELYGLPIHAFEHGSAQYSSRVLCTVDHAHLHLLPTAVNVMAAITGPEWQPLTGGIDALQDYTGADEYLSYTNPDGRTLITRAQGVPFESQYMRRIFATALGRDDEWNWRDNPRPGDADIAYHALSRLY